MLEKIKGFFAAAAGAVRGRASQLPPVAEAKPPRQQQILPSYLTSAKPSTDSPLPLNDRRLADADITALRSGTSTRSIIRDFAAASPDLSAAINAYLRTGITKGYTAVAKNLDGTFNREATQALHQLLTRFDVLQNYAEGFTGVYSLRTVSEMLGRELMLYGSMAAELVLDKALIPERIVPVSVTHLKFYPDKAGRRLLPKQEVGSEKIDLDIPTFFYVALDQDTLDPYSASPLESAIQPVIFSQDFINDVRRVVKRAIHPRIQVVINEEKFRKYIPSWIAYDQDKMRDYMSQVVAEIENRINGLKPEDALVFFDMLGIQVEDHGNTNLSNEYQVVQSMADAKLATGAKTLPAVLGHGAASANIASTETLVYMKMVEGSVWAKLNEMYSRILTLAVRLLGFDVYVSFAYDTIDLRPDSELTAFRVMEQERVLELLSLGFLTDEEASIRLTGSLPPENMQPLSGTFFKKGTTAEPTDNPYNGSSNSGSTLNQNLQPKTPTEPKGPVRRVK